MWGTPSGVRLFGGVCGSVWGLGRMGIRMPEAGTARNVDGALNHLIPGPHMLACGHEAGSELLISQTCAL